jgi:hypothetical protein
MKSALGRLSLFPGGEQSSQMGIIGEGQKVADNL